MTSRPSAGQDLEPSSAPPRKLPDEREEGKSGGALRSGCLSTPCLLTALSVLLTHSHAVFYVPLAGGAWAVHPTSPLRLGKHLSWG